MFALTMHEIALLIIGAGFASVGWWLLYTWMQNSMKRDVRNFITFYDSALKLREEIIEEQASVIRGLLVREAWAVNRVRQLEADGEEWKNA